MDWIYTHMIAFIIAISYTNAEPRCQNDYDIVGPGCLPSDADCNGDSRFFGKSPLFFPAQKFRHNSHFHAYTPDRFSFMQNQAAGYLFQ
jgi:hypothetical protein